MAAVSPRNFSRQTNPIERPFELSPQALLELEHGEFDDYLAYMRAVWVGVAGYVQAYERIPFSVLPPIIIGGDDAGTPTEATPC